MPINNTQCKKGRLTGLYIQPPDDWHFWNSLLQQIEARLGLKAFPKSTGFNAQTTNVTADLVSGCVRQTQKLRFVLFTLCTVRKLEMCWTKINMHYQMAISYFYFHVNSESAISVSRKMSIIS